MSSPGSRHTARKTRPALFRFELRAALGVQDMSTKPVIALSSDDADSAAG